VQAQNLFTLSSDCKYDGGIRHAVISNSHNNPAKYAITVKEIEAWKFFGFVLFCFFFIHLLISAYLLEPFLLPAPVPSLKAWKS
jgi:hypothetical protein